MTRILRPGCKKFVFLVLLVGCRQTQSTFSSVDRTYVEMFNEDFANYCNLDTSSSFQHNAFICTLVGDYTGAVKYATKHIVATKGNSNIIELSNEEKQTLELMINDTSYSIGDREMAKSVLNLESSSKSTEEIFRGVVPVDAKKYIIDESQKYHFLLLNEAHHSQQNRAFTTDLLRQLWEKGYRYLALEALGHVDTSLMSRGYPQVRTGFYTREPVFGNLVREAILIGYTLIPYEAKEGLWLSPTDRDREQASNIYNATYKNDSIGKVIIHAGYSHISELAGPEYAPMGHQLKKLSGQQIFTVDQQNMTELTDDDAMNPFYKFALNQFHFLTPVVLIDNEGRPFVDPLNSQGIDVQVFHPRTTLRFGRPSWLLNPGYEAYEVSDEVMQFKGHLIQAVIEQEDLESVPVDQFVINENRSLILKRGKYLLRIIDPHGSLVATCTLNAK
jgi:hypothetical protein